MIRYFKFFPYYLEIYAKRLSGRSLNDSKINGEYNLLKNIISQNLNQDFIFLDGGANIGEHSLSAYNLCKLYNLEKFQIYSIEAFPDTCKILKKNLSNTNCDIINYALSEKDDFIDFFYDSQNGCSGQNSTTNHYYLDSKIKIKTITLDKLIEDLKIPHVNFLKLDIEGSEYSALLGLKNSLRKGIIDYIQIEYNQTWIKNSASLEKVFNLCKDYNYDLFRINKNKLLSISKYSYILEDFVLSNLLILRKGCKLPINYGGEVLPSF